MFNRLKSYLLRNLYDETPVKVFNNLTIFFIILSSLAYGTYWVYNGKSVFMVISAILVSILLYALLAKFLLSMRRDYVNRLTVYCVANLSNIESHKDEPEALKRELKLLIANLPPKYLLTYLQCKALVKVLEELIQHPTVLASIDEDLKLNIKRKIHSYT